MNMYKIITKKLLVCLILVGTIFLNSFSVSLAQSLPDEDILQLYNIYNLGNESRCQTGTGGGSSSGSSITSGNLYILGDSITQGAESYYRTTLHEKGITPFINGSAGRSWAGQGIEGQSTSEGNTLSGKDAVNQDTNHISTANGVVIALGSNGGTGSNSVEEVVDTVRGINPSAPIWWVDTAGSSVYPSDLGYLGSFNQELHNKALSKNITVIPWSKTVNPNNPPENMPTDDIAGLLSDGLHPNETGYQRLSELVESTITGSSGLASVSIGECKCSVAGTIPGVDNPSKIWNFFAGKGLSAEQVAGILGNAEAESGYDPKITNGSSYKGLFQWDTKIRWPRLVAFSQEKGLDPETIEAQVEFAYHEAEERGNIEGIKEQSTVELATWYWGRFYEVAITSGNSTAPMTNVQHLDRRIKFANEAYTKYSGQSLDTGVGVSSGDCSSITGDGQPTQYVDNFPIYSQTDPRWNNIEYAEGRTIGYAGCGPAAMAMIITALTGKAVTPVETAKYAADNGQYVTGQGSAHSIASVLAPNWGLKATYIGSNEGAIDATLRAGGLVIAAGQGAKPFTQGGHYIVIRGLTQNNTYKVGDSGHSDTSEREWDKSPLLANMNSGSVYAITK